VSGGSGAGLRRVREVFWCRQDGNTWYSLEYGATSTRMAILWMSG
jgi:hypothetical protein